MKIAIISLVLLCGCATRTVVVSKEDKAQIKSLEMENAALRAANEYLRECRKGTDR